MFKIIFFFLLITSTFAFAFDDDVKQERIRKKMQEFEDTNTFPEDSPEYAHAHADAYWQSHIENLPEGWVVDPGHNGGMISWRQVGGQPGPEEAGRNPTSRNSDEEHD